MNQQQLNFFEPVERQIKPANGNGKMVDYGIQNDSNDFRVHVGYKLISGWPPITQTS